VQADVIPTPYQPEPSTQYLVLATLPAFAFGVAAFFTGSAFPGTKTKQ